MYYIYIYIYILKELLGFGVELQLKSSPSGITTAFVKDKGGWKKFNVTPSWSKVALPVGGRIVRLWPTSGHEQWRGAMQGYKEYPATHTATGCIWVQ